MTKGKLAIQHPKPNCKGNFFQRLLCWLFGMRKKETIRCSSFAAYGCFVGDPGDITGRVTSSDGTKHYDQKKTHIQGNLWALIFDVPSGTNYSLIVRGTNAHEVPRVIFDVRNYYAIGIAYPHPSDCPLCTNFVAYGSSNQDYAVSGTIAIPPAVPPPFNGTTIDGPPPAGAYHIAFTGIADGDNYRLNVVDSQGTAAPPSTPLSIRVTACN